ncbi:MAG: TraR/DksA C4-type zinc finger protein [Anaerolineae bacterium]|nr:TraR/DksA C4-type zinc finger protein [Anaerolineae bacterium]
MDLDSIKENLAVSLEEAKQEHQEVKKRLENKPSFGLGEGATLAYSWEMSLARRGEIEARIESLQEAVDRIEKGTYGYCRNCNRPINSERLEILPTTTLCTSCAAEGK